MRTPLRLLILAAVLLVVGWLLLPWEWSLIDDGQALGHVRTIGVRQTFELYRFTDSSWGLFRPLFWLYMGTFYLLPVKIAFTVRMLMLAVAVAVPAWLVWQRTGSRWLVAWAALLLAGNPSLLRNLAYPSLQEGPGVALVALGLLPYRRPWPRIVFWLAAAWFKSPFSWLLVCYGLLLLVRPGERRVSDRLHGAVALAAGAGTIVTAYTYSRAGDYTSSLEFGAGKLFGSALDAARQVGPPVLVVVLGVLAFGLRYAFRRGEAYRSAGWPLRQRTTSGPLRPRASSWPFGQRTSSGSEPRVASRSRDFGGVGGPVSASVDATGGVRPARGADLRGGAAGAEGVLCVTGGPDAPVVPAPTDVAADHGSGTRGRDAENVAWAVFGGGALYLANLLPWKTDEHYAGPFVYLLMAAVVLSVTPTRAPRRAALLAAALAALLLTGIGARYVYRNVANTAQLEACVLGLPGGPVVGYNRQEGAPRLTELAQLRRPGWPGQVIWVPNGAPAEVDYYIHQDQYGPGSRPLMAGPVVCRTPLATVYRTR
ncbi:hypothetical protein AB0M43_09460 [Longispora sp. NPDC051575]|uniref:hypothetical protein n=1 Tax=Longispora sp. NPDC051575 TaxID=3154943 RepID=UPI00341D0A47